MRFNGVTMRVAVLLQVSVWFTLIVPAHNRGAITLDADHGCCRPAVALAASPLTDSECSSCCSDPEPDERSDPSESDQGDPVRCCAICKTVAKMGDLGAALIFVPRVEPLGESIDIDPVAAPGTAAPLRFEARGPPAVA